ncbi:MAG: hypothetical protein Q9162_002573 [Coniocarpon cinnabarinum]
MGAGRPRQYRHLQRKSSHRQALLRNLVTSLLTHETIHTTWPKAKEAQRLAEKLITLGKRNTEASRRKALSVLFTPHDILPKLFGPLATRYATRPGGYTRVLRTEPKKEDQAPSAILELVDSPRDMRFGLTAQTIARDRALGREHQPLTLQNMHKVTAFRAGGETALEEMVAEIEGMEERGDEGARKWKLMKEQVYVGERNRWFYPAVRRRSMNEEGEAELAEKMANLRT